LTPSAGNHSVLILAGGRGERFWPWSRPERPKQLLPLARGGRTLLGATLERALRLVPRERVLILTARHLVEAVRAECPGVPVVGEPVPRNTAPAIGAAAAWFQGRGSGAFIVLPSDHLIDDLDAFVADATLAFEAAGRERVLLTFGIPASGPDTNFGYIQRGAGVGPRLHRVARFTEKPDRARAEQYLAGGEHLWNSGMFVWRPDVFLDALEAGRPALAAPLRGLAAVAQDERSFERALDSVFGGLESISVDYAVLEHAPNTLVLEAAFDWDDLGSWGAWARRQPRDGHGNVLFGDAVAVDCKRCIVVGEGGTAAALGLEDMVVVHVGDSTLACRLAETDLVRKVSEAVRERGRR
jgi:mannose-1-phosphate guanylyltransferase/mannose-6-phosphate isomerase